MPHIEILTIGDELLDGRLVDTNAADLSERLAAAGFEVARQVSVGDRLEDIAAALREAAGRSDAVLVSGGLGPTGDDLTAAAAAEAFGVPLARYEDALDHTRRFFASRGRRMTVNNEKQADLPAGSTLLPNPEGTAVGFRLHAGDCRLYFMPGVPRELERMFADSVLPDLTTFLTPSPPAVATLKVFGKGESEVAQMLEGLEGELPTDARLVVQYRATFPEIHIRLLVRGGSAAQAAELASRLSEQARRRLGRYLFAWGGERLTTTFADHAVDRLRRAGCSLAVAEGCTGGELAALLCSAAGAEEVLRGSVVVPDRGVQGGLLGLEDPLTEGHGPVSAAAAEALARAVRVRLAADLGVAVVGSPEGGGGLAPGALFVAVADRRGCSSRELVFPVDGERFRRLAAYIALAAALRSLDQPPA